MKKVLLATILMLNFSIANAQGFDWYKFSKVVNVGNQYNASISTIKYESRWEADGHCRQLGRQLGMDIRLADFKEVLEIAQYGNPQPDEVKVQINPDSKEKKIAIVAWDGKKAIKVDPKNPSNKDTKIMYKYRGEGGAAKVYETTLKEMTAKDKVLDFKDKPVDRLAAVCVHNDKKK